MGKTYNKNHPFLNGGIVFSFILIFLLSSLSMKSEIIKVENNEKIKIKRLLNIEKTSKLFQVYYIFDKNYCARCYNAEIRNGWLKTPQFLMKYIQVNFVTNNSSLQKYLNKNDTDRYKVVLYPKINKLKKYLNKALFYDSRNDKLFAYKISSGDFGVLYRYFDSTLYNDEKYFLKADTGKLIKSVNTGIPNYINNLSVSYDLRSNDLILYAKREATLWKFDKSLNLSLHLSLYENIKKNENDKSPNTYYHDRICLDKDIIYANSIFLSNPYDTIFFNRKSKRWRHYQQQLVYYHLDTINNQIILDSAVNQKERIGTFTKSINSNIVWGVYYLMNKDTVFGIFKLFYIDNNKRKNFSLPLKYYSGNPEYTCSYNRFLFTVNPYGKIFIIDTNQKVETINLSYYKNDKRLLTFFDGKNYSLTSHNSNYSYLVVYNELGVRQFSFSNKKFNAYYLYNSDNQTILEITKNENKDSGWVINLYKIIISN